MVYGDLEGDVRWGGIGRGDGLVQVMTCRRGRRYLADRFRFRTPFLSSPSHQSVMHPSQAPVGGLLVPRRA